MKHAASHFIDNDPPIWNQFVDSTLRLHPLYIGLERMLPHQKRLHTQPGLEINVCYDGKAKVVVGNHIYMQSTRQLVFIPGHIPHQVFPDITTALKRSVICIDPSFLPHPLDEDLLSFFAFKDAGLMITLEADTFAKMNGMIQRMQEEMARQQTGWMRVVIAQLLELMVLLQRSQEQQLERELKKSAQQTKNDFVPLCCSYIEAHLHENLSLFEVAKLFAVSPEHLTRLFRREKGTSFYQYVLYQRILASKEMFKTQPEMTITEIAYSLGFASSTQFGRTFKNMTGMTPTMYRQQMTASN